MHIKYRTWKSDFWRYTKLAPNCIIQFAKVFLFFIDLLCIFFALFTFHTKFSIISHANQPIYYELMRISCKHFFYFMLTSRHYPSSANVFKNKLNASFWNLFLISVSLFALWSPTSGTYFNHQTSTSNITYTKNPNS